MKNFTNNFKQFTSRLSARWLIMALMLLVGTSSAWGWTVYYDNTETKWSNVYVVLGHDNYHRGDYKMTKVSDSENLYYLTKDDWGDAKYVTFSNTIVAQDGSNNGFKTAITSGYYSFNNGASSLNHLLFKKNGTNLTTIEGLYPRLIFNCNHIGFYVGEYQNWNNQQFYVHTKNSDHISSISPFKDGTTSYYGVVYATSKKYNITHSMSWNGPALGISTALGDAYLVTDDNSIDASKKSTELSCNFSIDNTIKAGETTTVLSNSTSGKSYFANNANKKYEVDSYYVKKSGETSLTKLEVEGSELQTQSLAVGEYTIYVLLFDGRIYAKGGEQTLTVETACDKPDAPNFGTNGVEVCEGTQVTLPTIPDVTLKWYDENDQETTETFNATENKTYYAVVVGDCESDKTPYTITIKTKPTVTLNPTENTVCTDVTLGDITRYVEIESTEGSQISWYVAELGGDALATSTPLMETSYFAEATLNGCSSDRAEFTITDVLSAPTEVPNVTAPETICACESAVLELNNKDANYTYKVNEVKVDFTNNKYTVSPQETASYTIKAENKCGYKETTISITVNPLPTISISGNTSAVLYEDVVLTANNVTNGAQVNWYVGENLVAENTNTYTVTSAEAGEVIVKAKAFLNGCEFATTKTVTFSEENCTPEVSNDIQIKFYHPSAKSTDDAKKGQWWGMGTLYYSTNNSTWKSIDMGSSTSGSVTKTITNVTTNQLYVYFESYWTYSHNTKAKTNTLTLDRGNKYDIKITRHGDNNTSATATATKTGSLTKDPPITAPAVKMVSAEYDEVNDKIVATGAVYKTGCGETFWGFQYSTDGQTWGTTDADYIRPNSGNSLTKAGEFEHSFAIPNAGGGDIYYIRAYALNNYNNDNYNLSSAVDSELSIPVEIPSSVIESATISRVDEEGNPVSGEVCPQSTVYLKVSYVGGDFKEYEAADNFPGTNLELVNHDKVNNYAIFSYTATANGVANITISNDNTSIATTDGVSITLKDVAPVNAPMISINQATICDDGSATITVNNPIPGLTYTLYKETTKINGPVNYNDGALAFNNVTEAGSYTVRAEESVCNNYANSMAVDLKVVTSDVKIGLAVDKTTVNPWQPLKLTVTAPEGYAYTIVGLEDMVYTQSGNVYTVKIPRPTDSGWPIKGNSGTPVKTKDITFEAKIQVTDVLTCGSSSITVKLEDTEENCK